VKVEVLIVTTPVVRSADRIPPESGGVVVETEMLLRLPLESAGGVEGVTWTI